MSLYGLFQKSIGQLQANTILLYSNNRRVAVLFDPGDECPEIVNYIQDNNLSLSHILITHAHFDHMFGVGYVKKAFPKASVCCYKADAPLWSKNLEFADMMNVPRPRYFYQQPDICHDEHLTVDLGDFVLSCLHTPGHSPGSCCWFCEEQHIFISGDTIFKDGVGRTDLPGGNDEELKSSINKIRTIINFECTIIPGHGDNGQLVNALQNAEKYTNKKPFSIITILTILLILYQLYKAFV